MAKFGLCIGIDSYGAVEDNLEGAVNDARDWTGELRARQFDSIETLENEQAPRTEILERMTATIERAGKGDVVVITFSGHGTCVYDENRDEGDGRDEAICPVDVANRTEILDDELEALFSRARAGVRLVFIADCCSSGDLIAVQPPRRRNRFLSPLKFMKGRDLENVKRVANLPAKPARTGNALLLSACGDNGAEALETDDRRVNGAFTRSALAMLRERRPQNYRDWHVAIGPALHAAGFTQIPTITGTRDQQEWPIF